MGNFKKLNHVVYRCTYHIVRTPKYRYRVLEGLVKELLQKDICMLIEWKSCEMIEMNIQSDHVHLVVSVPSKSFHFWIDGNIERKNSHQDFQKLSSATRKTLLGQRLLCWHLRAWRRKNQEVREISRRSRTYRRTTAAQFWPLIGAFLQVHPQRRWIL